VLQDIDLNTVVAYHLFIAVGVGHVTDHDSLELAHVNQRRTDITGAKSCKNRRQAEILPPGIPDRGCLAMVVWMIFLDERVMPLPEDLPRLVAYDYATDWAAAFIIAFLCQQHRDAHKVRVR